NGHGNLLSNARGLGRSTDRSDIRAVRRRIGDGTAREDRRTRHQHVGPGGRDKRRGFRRDAPVDLDKDRPVTDHRMQGSDLIYLGMNEFLPSESWVDGHDADEVAEIEKWCRRLDCGARVEGKTGLFS